VFSLRCRCKGGREGGRIIGIKELILHFCRQKSCSKQSPSTAPRTSRACARLLLSKTAGTLDLVFGGNDGL
jgi:hypothetical protein